MRNKDEYDTYVNNIDNLNFILDEVCKTLGVPKEDLVSRRRKSFIVDARCIYTAIARESTTESLESIGGMINRDHSMSIHYLKKHEAYVSTDVTYRQKYNDCSYVGKSLTAPEFGNRSIVERLMIRNSILSEKFRYEKSEKEKAQHQVLRMKQFLKSSKNYFEC